MHPLELKVEHSLHGSGLDGPLLFVVGLSGGADSTALLAALTALGHRCLAAHVNYGLRGAESDRDEAFARSLARELGVGIEVLDAASEVAGRSGGESVEMACRRVRYRWFDELRHTHGIPLLAVGHNYTDNLETMTINLLRGTGLTGLAGMRPYDGVTVRPLLGVTRGEITAYLADRGLGHIEDSTNATDEFMRNRVRHHVIPAMRDASPQVSAPGHGM